MEKKGGNTTATWGESKSGLREQYTPSLAKAANQNHLISLELRVCFLVSPARGRAPDRCRSLNSDMCSVTALAQKGNSGFFDWVHHACEKLGEMAGLQLLATRSARSMMSASIIAVRSETGVSARPCCNQFTPRLRRMAPRPLVPRRSTSRPSRTPRPGIRGLHGMEVVLGGLYETAPTLFPIFSVIATLLASLGVVAAGAVAAAMLEISEVHARHRTKHVRQRASQ